MEIIIKATDKSDYTETENLTREAFWNLYKPGCDEHLVLHQLRKSNSYIAALDFVALDEGRIIGHIISTKARVTDNQGKDHEVLCAGPLAVLPELQSKGIGAKLMMHSISIARELGYSGMILFGNPDYYKRFGYVNAQEYEIATKEGQNFDPFMALELRHNALKEVKGRFFEEEAFTTNEDELIEFEKQFPFKEKGKAKIDLSQYT
jgi:predicted N-acetyltransferase YhbS